MRHSSFKSALHESTFRSSLPAKALADRIGIAYQTLAEFSDDGSSSNIPVRRLVALLAVADNISALEYLAAVAGCVVFRVPTHGAAVATADAVREIGQWLQVHAAALSDGVLSQDDYDRVDADGQRAIAAIAAAIDEARRRVHVKVPVSRGDSPLARVR